MEMRDNNEGVGQTRTWSHMRTSPVRRGSYVLKDQGIQVLGLERGCCGMGCCKAGTLATLLLWT